MKNKTGVEVDEQNVNKLDFLERLNRPKIEGILILILILILIRRKVSRPRPRMRKVDRMRKVKMGWLQKKKTRKTNEKMM